MDGVQSVSTKSKSSVKSPPPSSSRRRRTKTICITIGIVLLVVVIVMVILGFTVFKAKKPVITVGSVSIEDLDLSINLALKVSINASLDVNLSVENPNRVGFKFNNASALLYYNGTLVGEVPIPAGKIGARSTIEMNVTLALMADRLLSNPNLYSDVLSGSLPLSAHARISGKVPILFLKIKVVSTTTCNIILDTKNRTVKDNVLLHASRSSFPVNLPVIGGN